MKRDFLHICIFHIMKIRKSNFISCSGKNLRSFHRLVKFRKIFISPVFDLHIFPPYLQHSLIFSLHLSQKTICTKTI